MIDALQIAVRPVVTFMFASVLCYGFATKLVGAEAFLSIVSTVITFWFTQRATTREKLGGDPNVPPAPPEIR